MTQSLLSSWNYMYNCREECAEEAKESFLRTLRREPTYQTEDMLNGIEFEQEVYKEAAGEKRDPHPKWEKGISATASFLLRAPTQVKLSSTLVVDGRSFLLYGILDALKLGVIYDVKFSGSYEAGKYLDSPQHSMYFQLCPEAYRFLYLVSDGEDLFVEPYKRNLTRPISEIISEFMRSIELMGLLDVYLDKWKAVSNGNP
jgi:hypothetical protein